MLRRGRTHDGSVTVPYKFSKEFPEVQLANLIRFMQNPEDSLVRPDYELILCIDYLLKVNIWAFVYFYRVLREIKKRKLKIISDKTINGTPKNLKQFLPKSRRRWIPTWKWKSRHAWVYGQYKGNFQYIPGMIGHACPTFDRVCVPKNLVSESGSSLVHTVMR